MQTGKTNLPLNIVVLSLQLAEEIIEQRRWHEIFVAALEVCAQAVAHQRPHHATAKPLCQR